VCRTYELVSAPVPLHAFRVDLVLRVLPAFRIQHTAQEPSSRRKNCICIVQPSAAVSSLVCARSAAIAQITAEEAGRLRTALELTGTLQTQSRPYARCAPLAPTVSGPAHVRELQGLGFRAHVAATTTADWVILASALPIATIFLTWAPMRWCTTPVMRRHSVHMPSTPPRTQWTHLTRAHLQRLVQRR